MKRIHEIDESLIIDLEKIKNGANCHTINKAINYYKYYCKYGSKKPTEYWDTYIESMRRATSGNLTDIKILKWL